MIILALKAYLNYYFFLVRNIIITFLKIQLRALYPVALTCAGCRRGPFSVVGVPAPKVELAARRPTVEITNYLL